MTYCVEHVSLVGPDINTEKSEVMIKKSVQTPHKTVQLPHRTCAVWHVFDKEEY